MQGKPLAMTDSRSLAYALDKLSKNTALDMLLDLCHREIGEHATDAEIANWFLRVNEPVAIVRGDKPVNFAGHMAKFSKAAADYVAAHS